MQPEVDVIDVIDSSWSYFPTSH